MTRQRRLLAVTAVVGAVVALAATASAASPGTDNFGGRNSLHESLSSYNEPHSPCRRTGAGQFRATINDRTQEDHLHAQLLEPGGNGHPVAHPSRRPVDERRHHGVPVLETWATARWAPRPAPPPRARSPGTLKAVDVIGPAAQGLTAGQFAELVKAIRAGVTYVNVHRHHVPGRRDPGPAQQ